MKHVKGLTQIPAKALLPEGHPGIVDSLTGLIEMPVEVIQSHLDHLKKEVNPL